MKHLISLTTPRNIRLRHTRASIVEEALTWALIVKQGTHPSLIRVSVTIKILVITNLHFIHLVCHSSSTVVRSVEVHIIVMIAKQGTHPSMIRVLVTIKIIVMTSFYSILRIINKSFTIMRYVEVPIIALILRPGTSLSMSLILYCSCHTSATCIPKPPPSVLAAIVAFRTTPLMGERSGKCFPFYSPPDVLGDVIVDIDLPLGEHLDTLSMGDREIDFNPSRDIEELEHLLADDPVPVPMEFDI
ncbi:hypothetical protein Tco_0606649 [Tanacetum coccineum]